MPRLLTVESLSKSFMLHVLDGRRMLALQDVSFDVGPGEFLGVVGRSGSGKSSLLRCLYRRYLPTAGRMLYESKDGPVDLPSVGDREILRLRRREIGYVSQFLRALPRTAARDVVAEPLALQGLPLAKARREADETLEALGLPAVMREALPATMSGGEQQRVNLGRALASRPRLLLLDEPTSALDPATRGLAVQAIRESKGSGTTMIGVFHDAETLSALADRVLALEDGRVVGIGSPEDAMGMLRRSA